MKRDFKIYFNPYIRKIIWNPDQFYKNPNPKMMETK